MPPGRGSRRSRSSCRSPTGEVRSWTVHEGMRPGAALRRVDAGHRRRARSTRLAGGAAPARHRRPRPRADRPVAGGRRSATPHEDGRRITPLHLVPARRPDRQRLRPPDRGRHRALRHRRATRCSRSSTTASCRMPTEPRRATSPTTIGPHARPTSKPTRDHAARRPELHRRRQPRRAGRSGSSASASTRTRAWCCTSRLPRRRPRRGRSCTARRSARWSCPTATPAPMHGWKNAFDAGEWGLGRMTHSLTLGCDCLGEIHYFDATLATEQGEPCGDRERDLHARGGLRDPLEARRPAAAARARCGAAVASSSASSRPSATTSTASTGTSTSTATSSSR